MLSKRLKPEGPIRYMRLDEGKRRCKVHVVEAVNNRAYLVPASATATTRAIEPSTDEIARQKAEIKKQNQKETLRDDYTPDWSKIDD